jgi:hypothetical protein
MKNYSIKNIHKNINNLLNHSFASYYSFEKILLFIYLIGLFFIKLVSLYLVTNYVRLIKSIGLVDILN